MTDLPPFPPGANHPQPVPDGPERAGWDERIWAARLVGIVIYLVPFAVSVGAAFVLSSLLPQAPNLAIGIVRWLGIAIVSTIMLMLVERQTRRLLPLKTLLGLSLNFPDKAPSRFKIAIRTGTTSQLRQRLSEAREGRLGDTPSEAAERLLELVGMLSQHDRLTRGHSERVRAYSHMIGEEMGMSGRELDRLRWAGLLHDVGKLAISPDVLNKPGKLTAEEYELVKRHPMEGKKLVEPLAGWLGEAARAVWEHHERYDGGGYPMGLSGTEISRAARIVSVADVFDVITSVRSYKHATSASGAREELARCAGTQFDPEVVRAFLALSVGRVRRTIGPLSWVTQLALFPGAIAAQAGPVLASAAVVTAGAAAGTVGIVADPEPAVAHTQRTLVVSDEFVAGALGTPSTTVVVIEQVAPLEAIAPQPTSPPEVEAPPAGAAPTPDPTLSAVVVSPGTVVPSVSTPRPGTTVSATIAPSVSLPEAAPLANPEPEVTVAPVVSATATTTTSPPETPTTTTTSLPPTTTSTTTTSTSTIAPTTTTLPPTTTTTTTTTTLPPTTTTSTTLPPTTTTTSTTLPPTTTTTTTSTTLPPTTTTTTLPPEPAVDFADDVFLVPGRSGNRPSTPLLGLSNDAPTRNTLFNYDTDRDSFRGLLLRRHPDGVDSADPDFVQAFGGEFVGRSRIDSNVRLDIAVAASGFADSSVRIQARLEVCTNGVCDTLSTADQELSNGNSWRNVVVDFGHIDYTADQGAVLLLTVGTHQNSPVDAMIAYGTESIPGVISFN